MKNTTLSSPIKRNTIHMNHTFHRNAKSLKRLGFHLQNYQLDQDPEKLQSYSLKKNSKSTQNQVQSQLHQKSQSQLLSQSQLFSQSEQNKYQGLANTKQAMDSLMNKKIQTLINNLLLNIQIFQKIFASSIRKKQIISKLYGWDPIFEPVFFPKHQENFKAKLCKQMIILELNLDKNTFASRNIYNKLRFFLAELVDLNFKQQDAQCSFQRQRLTESSHKLLNKLQIISKQTQRKSTQSQISRMRATHLDLFNKKMRIKNRGKQLQKITGTSGNVKLHPFFLKEERNIEDIQNFLKLSLIK